jgi:hypothetical protein
MSACCTRPRLAALPDWTVNAEMTVIRKELVAKNWQCAMDLVNAISPIAEEEGREDGPFKKRSCVHLPVMVSLW